MDLTPGNSQDQERIEEMLSPREAALTAAEKRLGDYLNAQYGLALASSDPDKHAGIEHMWQRIGASYGSFWHLATIVLDAALPYLVDPEREAAYRAGREDAAQAIEESECSHECAWGFDAAALARGQQPREDGDR